MKNRKWTDQEILLLKNKVTFNEQGLTNNALELSILFGREVGAIYRKVYRLRKEGALPDIYYDDQYALLEGTIQVVRIDSLRMRLNQGLLSEGLQRC